MTERHPLPQLLLERLAAGELPPDQAAAARARLEQEPEGEARLSALHASNDAILAAHPPRVLAAAVRQRHDRQRASRRRLLLAVPLAAAAAAVVAMFVGPLLSGSIDRGLGPERPKGPPILTVFRKGARGEEPLQAGDRVRTGDLLQMTYSASGARHGVIFSLDGRGKLTLHHPSRQGQSTALRSEGVVALPFAYELDDAPNFECFFFVTSNRPIETARLLERVRALGPNPRSPLPLEQGMSEARVLLQKAQRDRVK